MQGRLAGHPIHVMLIHFPSALFPVSVLLDWISFFAQGNCINYAAFYTLSIGIISAVAAALFGAIEYAKIPSSHAAWNTASLHAVLNVLWILLFAVIFGLKVKNYSHLGNVTIVELAIETLTVIGLILSNYLGGELVFKYKIGMKEE